MITKVSNLAAFALCLLFARSGLMAGVTRGYAVVVSETTWSDSEWRKVSDELAATHQAQVVRYDRTIFEAKAELQRLFPKHLCFVARPEEATRDFVAQAHQLARVLDDDPYPDCLWGILTGYDAANALRIARIRAPLTIRKIASGTPFPLERCEAGVYYSELEAGRFSLKETGGEIVDGTGPHDSTEALVKTLTEWKADAFITSGHATEREWQIGYRYRNGYFRCENGMLYGEDTQKRRIPIHSPNPKVYLPVGNCLMGHIDGREAMALAFLNSGGVVQMIGYTVETWYGYAGWGCLDYFIEQPGRYTFAEAFLANQVALIHRLQTYFPDLAPMPFRAKGDARPRIQLTDDARDAGLRPQDGLGLLHDREVLAFYGDPAWEARLAPASLAWEQALTEAGGEWTFTIKPSGGEGSFAPKDANGSQRGGRPFIHFLPHRVRGARVTQGGEFKPVITDDFILVPNPGKSDGVSTLTVRFRAEPEL